MPQEIFVEDPELTAIAIGYKNEMEDYIADEVFPDAPVTSSSFKYSTYPKNEGYTVPDTLVGRTSKPNIVNFSAEEKTESVEDHALDAPVPYADVEKAPKNYKPKDRATMSVTNLLMLDHELRSAKIARNPANYGLKETLAGESQFSHTASDPLRIIIEAASKMLVKPNTLILGRDVWNYLRLHPKIVKATHGNSGDSGVAAREAVAELLEVKKVLVGDSLYNRARKGQPVSLERCWSNICALLRIDPNADTQNGLTFGLTARFGTRIAGTIFDPDMGMRGGERVRVGEAIKELAIAPDCGYLFENAIAAPAV